MPFVGRDVFEFISEVAGEEHGVNEDASVRVVAPIVSAIAHLHRCGYAHRDVKSENILVSWTMNDDGQPHIHSSHLIDFDMCCAVDDASPRDGCGSLGFMAPESMIKQVFDPAK